MLSVPHMIVIFVVVLVVFGPKKLPELARGLGKLMAEFRKASTDFRSAFEQEMRDLERQAMAAERKKQAEAAAKAATEQTASPGTAADTAASENAGATATGGDSEACSVSESEDIAPVISPVPEAVARSTEEAPSTEAQPARDVPASRNGDGPEGASATSANPDDLAHDVQRPA